MRILIITITIYVAYAITGCSSKGIVVTDQYAYYRGDDSIDVVKQYNTLINDSGKSKVDSASSENDVPPIVSFSIYPNYPLYKLDMVKNINYIIEGEVMVAMAVTDSGIVRRAFIKASTHPIFNNTCLNSAMNWKFSPALSRGNPVNCIVQVPFKFRYKKQ